MVFVRRKHKILIDLLNYYENVQGTTKEDCS